MTTKQITNESIFERLGWELFPKIIGEVDDAWADTEGNVIEPAPDPLHNLNDTFKYVWPAYLSRRYNKHAEALLIDAWYKKSPEKAALFICQAFMDLPVEGEK